MSELQDRSAEPAEPDYKALARFRYELRRFSAFSKAAVEAEGLAPQQYQALLAIKSCGDEGMSVTELSEQLFIRLHSAVELASRLERADLVRRIKPPEDRRRVLLHTTPHAEEVLKRLVTVHHHQLGEQAEALVRILSGMTASRG